LFAVSDGMGGAKSGEIASRLAVDRIAQLLPQHFAHAASRRRSGARGEVLAKVFSSIHHDLLVLGASYEECAGMGATLSLCWMAANRLYFGHVGDSRIYALPAAGGISQLTDDHNHVGWLRRKGQITEREARNHPLRHSLHQAIGAGLKTIDPHIGACAATVLVTGFSSAPTGSRTDCGIVTSTKSCAIRATGVVRPSVAQRIVKEAVEQSGRDNATALVFELHAPASRPSLASCPGFSSTAPSNAGGVLTRALRVTGSSDSPAPRPTTCSIVWMATRAWSRTHPPRWEFKASSGRWTRRVWQSSTRLKG
jgi:serine/threonine protein phosphatase PrpC